MLLKKTKLISGKTIEIGGSKSISNRLLILRALFGAVKIANLSTSEDTSVLQYALSQTEGKINVGHAGTAMRFLTAYFAAHQGAKVILTGSERMKQRPIKPLVDALKALGAEIAYVEKEGFPPLKITGKTLDKSKVEINAGISSQFLTAMMLVGAKLPNGLVIIPTGKLTSAPYLKMTVGILKRLGIPVVHSEDVIRIPHIPAIENHTIVVESDWSSSSYFYMFAAIGRGNISLKYFDSNSLQGDSAVADIYYKFFGIGTTFGNGGIDLSPIADFRFPEIIELDMNDCPDLAQSVAVTAATLKIPFKLTGLHTLKLKETDRLRALQNELEKIGAVTEISAEGIVSKVFKQARTEIIINTYEDHRMAMSFAPASLLYNLAIENPDVVKKSYPDFWEDYAAITE